MFIECVLWTVQVISDAIWKIAPNTQYHDIICNATQAVTKLSTQSDSRSSVCTSSLVTIHSSRLAPPRLTLLCYERVNNWLTQSAMTNSRMGIDLKKKMYTLIQVQGLFDFFVINSRWKKVLADRGQSTGNK